MLVTSELVTNAVKHTTEACELHAWYREEPPSLRVEVCDSSQHLPTVPPRAAPDSPGGRGLLLVDALATAWGTERRSTGKVVWFEMNARHGKD